MTIELTITQSIRALKDGLEPFLKKMGAMAVSFSQRSFNDQSFDGREWDSRYPNQSEPFINVAGSVSDLASGGQIKERRFSNRPALLDTGTLRGSIAFKVVGPETVEVGTNVEYADLQQRGGESSQPITPTVKQGLKDFLDSGRGERYKEKVGFLLGIDELKTQVVGRQFIGVTDELETDLANLLEQELQDAGEKGA